MIMAPQADKLVCSPRIRRIAAKYNGDLVRLTALGTIDAKDAIKDIDRCCRAIPSHCSGILAHSKSPATFAGNFAAKCQNESGIVSHETPSQTRPASAQQKHECRLEPFRAPKKCVLNASIPHEVFSKLLLLWHLRDIARRKDPYPPPPGVRSLHHLWCKRVSIRRSVRRSRQNSLQQN
jgi:hypothetical protein